MNIKIEQLASQMKTQLLPIYIVSGDEPLQLAEAQDMIRAHARNQDFSEREVFHLESGFDWGSLYEAGNTLSLFAARKIIELRLPKLKIGDEGAKALMDYAKNPSSDNLLIIAMPKLDANVKKAKWFKELEAVAGLVQVWPIEGNQLVGWISRRMRQRGLLPTQDAVSFLAEKVEGNLLAAAQEIEKLALLHQGEIDLDIVVDSVADSAKFDVFSLVDVALQGDPHRIDRVLSILRSSGVEPILVQWALAREIRELVELSLHYRPGPGADALFKKHRIWGNRVSIIRRALDRSRPKLWQSLLCHSARIDRMIKGMSPGNCWDELLKLALAMGGTELLRESA